MKSTVVLIFHSPKTRKSYKYVAVLIVLSLLCVCHLRAQNRDTAEIVGKVTDSSGAVVPSVNVAVRSEETNVVTSVTTTGSGVYDVPLLPPGRYTITFTHEGFKTFQREGISLELDQTARINAQLQIGQVQQVINVVGATPLLDTASSQVETVFSSELTHNLPLVGRNPSQLAILAPGTSTAQSVALGVGPGGTMDPGRVNVAGARSFTINATLNGGPVVLPDSNNFGNMIPSLDAISEFSVIQNNFGAQFGVGTSVLNMIVKSGTSQYHGSIYEFFENDALDATSGFSTRKPKLRYNQFGGTIGGPITKKKLFFFFGYQNTLVPSSSFGVVTVPTAAEAAGDFSAFLTPNASDGFTPIVIYDRNTGKPYPGNQIPANEIDPVAKATLSYWPSPNYGPPGTTANNYGALEGATPKTPIYDARVDWDISQANQLFGSLHVEPYSSVNTGLIPGPACEGGCGAFKEIDEVYQATDKWMINPHAVNVAYATFTRDAYSLTPPSKGGDYPAKLGLSANNISQEYFPSFSFSGAVPASLGPGTYYGPNTENSFTYSDLLNWIVGKHSLSIGGQLNKAQFDVAGDVYGPSFSFNGQYTAMPTGPISQQSPGIGFADFLLGDVYYYNFSGMPLEVGGRRKSFAAFVQDDWAVTPTLTLNLGLRYQFEGTWSEAHNILSNFSPTEINPATQTPGAIVYASSAHPYIQNSHPYLFAPRVGFAKMLGSRSVVRGGFGIFYEPLGGESNFNSGAPGYAITQTLFAQTPTSPPVFQLQAGPPPYTTPSASTRNGAIDNGQSTSWWPQGAKQTYEDQYHLSIQRQFGSNMTGQISYVGAKGLHLYFPRDANQVPLAEMGSEQDRTNPQALRPFPQYQGISTAFDDASSNYNALELVLQRRFANGVSLLANYTYSKSMDTSSEDMTSGLGSEYQVSADPSVNYARSDFSQTHRLVVAYVLELPVGRGKKFLNSNRLADAVVGGWTTAGSFTANSGAPFTISASGTQTTGLLAGYLYANCIGNKSGPHTAEEWFNTSNYSDPGNYTIGTCSRDSAVGPGAWDFDVNLMKNFQLYKSAQLQVRADAFNILNHRSLLNPDGQLGSSAFGTISSSSPPRVLEVGAHITF